jgi:hypothetical protein
MKQLSMKQAGIIAIVVSVLMILLHALVIAKLIPFQWINGGLIATYEASLSNSITGIGLMLLFIFIYLMAGGWILKGKFPKLVRTLLWGMFGFWLLSVILQLLGTPFEKAVLTILCLVNVFTTYQLIKESKKQEQGAFSLN